MSTAPAPKPQPLPLPAEARRRALACDIEDAIRESRTLGAVMGTPETAERLAEFIAGWLASDWVAYQREGF